MADYRLLFPNDYLGAHEFMGKDVTKRIKSLAVENLRCEGGKVERRPVLSFHDSKKKFVVNKTNAKAIAALYGNDTSRWIDQPITMFPTTCKFGRDTVDCIRIRNKRGSVSAPVDEHPYDIEGGEETDASDHDHETGDVREPGQDG